MYEVKSMARLLPSEKAVLFALYQRGGALDAKDIARHSPSRFSRTTLNSTLRALEARHAVTVAANNQSAAFTRRRAGMVRLTDMALRWMDTNQAVFNGFDELVQRPLNRRPSARRLLIESCQKSAEQKSAKRPYASTKNRAPHGLGAARFCWWLSQHDFTGEGITVVNRAYGTEFGVTLNGTEAQKYLRAGLIARNVDGAWVLTDKGLVEAEKWVAHLAATPVTDEPVEAETPATEPVDADEVAAALLDRVVELLTAGEKVDTSHALRIEKLEGQLRVAMEQYDRVVTERDTIKANLDLAQSQLAATAEELERIIRGGSRRIRKESLEYLQNISKGA